MRSLYRVTLAGLGLLVPSLACKAPPLPESTLPREERTIGEAPERRLFGLGGGDRVHVTVLGHPELSTPADGVLVDREARVHLPLVGAVPIGGLDTSEAEELVEARFAAFVKEPDITLTVGEYAARRVYVFGQVDEPGAYVLDRALNAHQALALAGGFAEGADRAHACVLRARDGFVEVHVFDAATPDAGGLVQLWPEDFVFVRQSGAGTFREQVLPYVQGIQPILSSLINLGLVANAIND